MWNLGFEPLYDRYNVLKLSKTLVRLVAWRFPSPTFAHFLLELLVLSENDAVARSMDDNWLLRMSVSLRRLVFAFYSL